MSAARYAQVRRLFLAACELAESEIGAFLDHACAGDLKLRQELESLLKQPRSTTIIGTSSAGAAHDTDLLPADTHLAAATAENPWRFSPGEIIVAERYLILGPLGGGGAGEVYRAHDQIMNQDVALKFLALGQTADDAARSRFVSEVTMAREVTHPNVVRVHDIGQLADGELFISMEFIDGDDLASLLRRAGRLSREKTVQIAKELCAGLSAAHDHGVLHRDLKPANIVIDGDGHAHIADFGIAALLASAGGDIPLAGTPAFMAPGLFHHKQPSKQSDLYALGLVLYEVATGKEPFGGVPAHGRPVDAPLIRPSVSCPDIEPAVERAILQCLEDDPSRRPESARAIAALLPE